MRTPPSEELTDVARRRLESLRRQLQPETDDPLPPVPSAPASEALAPAGRHARPSLSRSARIGAWASERTPATLQGRVRLGTRELGVLAVLLGVALAIAGWLALKTGSAEGDAVPASAPAPTSAKPLVGAASPIASARSGATKVAPSGDVVVDVAGKVRRPGVVTLPSGARVVDAIRKAGGAKPKVDLSGLNLARVLTDGEQVLVGTAAGGGTGAASAPGAPAGGLVSLNTASPEQLDGLPGVGPVTAQKIISWRESNGSFSAVDELLEVDGIGEKTLAELVPHVTL